MTNLQPFIDAWEQAVDKEGRSGPLGSRWRTKVGVLTDAGMDAEKWRAAVAIASQPNKHVENWDPFHRVIGAAWGILADHRGDVQAPTPGRIVDAEAFVAAERAREAEQARQAEVAAERERQAQAYRQARERDLQRIAANIEVILTWPCACGAESGVPCHPPGDKALPSSPRREYRSVHEMREAQAYGWLAVACPYCSEPERSHCISATGSGRPAVTHADRKKLANGQAEADQ